jgi:xanthine/CO dehydrogenase XdhC/CoxF family maturation factor
MRELQGIVEAAEEAERGGKTAILATVVQVEGSAYRRPGAHMLITEDGWRAGSISGGCLESDLLERARALTEAGQPALVTYNTTDAGDVLLGVGLGCRGVIRVLVERLAPGRTPDPMAFLRSCLRDRRTGILATVFRLEGPVSTRVGARLLLHHDGRVSGDIQDAELTALVEEDARKALAGERSMSGAYSLQSGAAEVFLEAIRPPIPLVVFGAGHDAVPIVRLAKELGWHVTVVDGRSAYATSARFPSADSVVLSLPETMRDRVPLDKEAAALVMTHNYLQDRKLLEALLPSPVRYIGVLGPKSRTDEILSDLRSEGVAWTEEQLARLYAPVGLDIGTEGPEGIALAILAEIQAVRSNRFGGCLRQRTGPIHVGSGSEEPANGQRAWTGAKAACGLSAS